VAERRRRRGPALGTDNVPSEAARPAVALTAVPPMPGELNAPAPEPTPVLIADPDIWKL
jgi:hypothetical protein